MKKVKVGDVVSGGEEAPKSVRMNIRFGAAMERDLRQRAQYLGDISGMIQAACSITHALDVPLIESMSTLERSDHRVQIVLTGHVAEWLKRMAGRRGCTMTLLLNSILEHAREHHYVPFGL